MHTHDGWYFRREPGGHVAIEVAQTAQIDAPLLVGATFDPDTWASIVASVSGHGETAETWRAVRLFHQPHEPPPRRDTPRRGRVVDLGEIVQYRGLEGRQVLRAAIVTATIATLDPAGVDAGDVPALDSPAHVHLHVLTPSERAFFVEYNVPRATNPTCAAPGTWQRHTRGGF